MLESAIAAGVTAAGGDALLAGVLPTPAAPLLVRRHGLQLAAVISASHNPYEDNGIKLFAADGFKLDDDTEHEIEAALGQPPAGRRPDRPRPPPARRAGGLPARAAHPLRRPGPQRPAGPAGLRQRRHLPRRPGDLPPARRRGRGDGRRARRAQHQRRRAARPTSTRVIERIARRRLRAGLRLRRRRRPRAGRRRRRARSSTATSWSRWPRCTCTRHDRLPGGGVAVTVMTNYGFHTAMATAGRRGGDHRGRRPLRARRAAPARLGARRRAVGPHHRPRLRPLRRRDRQRPADARGAGRRATCATAARWRSCPSGWSTSAPPTAPR